jgi:hypothetical protein
VVERRIGEDKQQRGGGEKEAEDEREKGKKKIMNKNDVQ